MTFRFHRRLALWNILILLLVILISGLNFPPLSLLALTVGVLSTLLVSYALKLRVSVPLSDLLAAIQKMGDGDLQQRVPVKGDPEVAELLRATNTMARHLGSTDRQLREAQGDIDSFVDAMTEAVLRLDA